MRIDEEGSFASIFKKKKILVNVMFRLSVSVVLNNF